MLKQYKERIFDHSAAIQVVEHYSSDNESAQDLDDVSVLPRRGCGRDHRQKIISVDTL